MDMAQPHPTWDMECYKNCGWILWIVATKDTGIQTTKIGLEYQLIFFAKEIIKYRIYFPPSLSKSDSTKQRDWEVIPGFF